MSPAAEHVPWRWLAAARASRRLVLVVVFVALLLDNMLLTVVGTALLLVSAGCWEHSGHRSVARTIQFWVLSQEMESNH